MALVCIIPNVQGGDHVKLPRNLLFVFALLPVGASPVMAAANLVRVPLNVSPPSLVERTQFTFQLGVPDRRVVRILNQQGYSEVKIVYRGMTKSTAEACKKGVKYSLQVTPRGRVKSVQKIGNCRKPINAAQAEDRLARVGYRGVRVERDELGAFVATGCLEGQRYEISLNQFGDIGEKFRLGYCRDGLSPRDITAKLRSRGYNRISFKDSGSRRHVIEACRKLRKFELRVSRNGEIRRSKRIGRCSPPIKPSRIARILANRGLNRIEVINSKPPRYLAEACWGENRVRIALNRYGDSVKERRIGKCLPPVTKEQLTESMYKLGFRNISFAESRRPGFVVNACLEGRLQKLIVNRYGETMDEDEQGPCPSPRLQQILQRYQDRGFSDVKIVVEGCRRNRRVELTLDPYGGVLKRDRAGRCK